MWQPVKIAPELAGGNHRGTIRAIKFVRAAGRAKGEICVQMPQQTEKLGAMPYLVPNPEVIATRAHGFKPVKDPGSKIGTFLQTNNGFAAF
jgi:hypothetical protein